LTVKDPAELEGLARGDEITFSLRVTDDEDWIESIRKTGRQIEAPSRDYAAELPPDFDSLEVGDFLPDCVLTNEFGGVFRLSDYRGTTLALTFFFTRCPLPTYCPLMSRNFAEAYRILSADPDSPGNWRLLSVSFDPEFDTPEVLSAYAQAYRDGASRWQFATGAMAEIERVSRPLGLMLVREEGAISHNLRTVVVDADGRIAKLFLDNAWKPEELAAAIREADIAKPAAATTRDSSAETTACHLEISGMKCEACAKTIRSHLLKSPGVQSVNLVWTNPVAVVDYQPGKTSPKRLIEVVRDLEYGAELSPARKE
jgi:protein SCO1/2